MTTPDYQQVRELFRKSILIPEPERSAYLENECPDDPLVREAVEELLRFHSTQPLLQSEAQSSTSQRPSATVAQNLDATLVEAKPRHRFIQRISSRFQREKRVLTISILTAAVLFGLAGAWVHRSIYNSLKERCQSTLNSMLDQHAVAVRQWLESEASLVRTYARLPELRKAVVALRAEWENPDDPTNREKVLESMQELRAIVKHLGRPSGDGVRYAVWSRSGVLIADSDKDSTVLGNTVTPYGASLLSRPFSGENVIWFPTTSGYITREYAPPANQQPELAILVPIYDLENEDRPIGCLLVSEIGLQEKFEAFFDSAQFGKTGEFYALDSRGYLITESRFREQLYEDGLIDAADTLTAGNVRVADPGIRLNRDSARSVFKRDELPLTRAAAGVVAGHAGDNFQGYRDYRGIEVVGAWQWLDDLGIGIIVELDIDEAFETLVPLRRAFWMLIGLLGLALVWLTAVSVAWVNTRHAVGIASQIGPYKVDRKIGEGGLGQVFLATHVLLKRPTALKLLKPDAINVNNQRRFKREIHLASSLMHPNTIEIYDYGSTADGGFYSAMEYVDGLNLTQVVELDGPQRPERVVWILTEACRSLREAHAKEMIHRDIKPENIMLCCHGGEADSVKVLDFGLAREIDQPLGRVTETQILVGTPMYIAPERITDPTLVDPRSDVYSLGVLAFYLLTAREPFEANDAIEALAGTLQIQAPAVSEYCPWPIPSPLESLVSSCLEKNLDQRVPTIDALIDRLKKIECDASWTRDRAAIWWWKHAPKTATRSQIPDLSGRS